MFIATQTTHRADEDARPPISLRLVFAVLAVTVVFAANAPLLAMAARIVA